MRYVLAIGQLSAFALAALSGLAQAAGQDATITYYYTDPQGTVLATTDAQGNIISLSDHRPYGEQALGTPQAGPGYTGHVNDPDTGLVYMQARYYDPTIGRFLSVDPKGPSAGDLLHFNRYAYANNNPFAYTDPDGRDAQLYWRAPNQATLTIPYILGLSNGAQMSMTTAQINQAVSQNLSGTVNVNGVSVTVTAVAIEANGSNTTGHTNFLRVVPDTNGVTSKGRSETNAVGGDHVTIGATGPQRANAETVSHEFGHVAGAGDRYAGGNDVNGHTLVQDAPGGPDIMKVLNRGPAGQQTLSDIIHAPTNTNTCSPGVSAPNGGC